MKREEMLSFVLRARKRRQVLQEFLKGSKTPAELMKATWMYRSHISRALKELEKNMLIVCVNPKDRAYRFYRLSKYGKTILKEIDKRF